MSIIINTNPPRSCWECKFEKILDDCPCNAGAASASRYLAERHENCPIREIDEKED